MKTSAALPLLLTFTMMCATPAFADKPKVKGYYLDNTGQKQSVMIEVPTKMLNSKKVDEIQRNHFTIFDKRGKETKLDAKSASEFGFTFDGTEYVFRLLPNAIQNVTHVLADYYLVLMEGPCTVYLTFVNQNSYYTEYCLYKNENQYYITTTGITNRFVKAKGRIDTMDELFSDCPDLVEKLKTKEYKKGDDRWFRIAQYYNQSCQSTEKSTENASESD
jgi:hypothetical protein